MKKIMFFTLAMAFAAPAVFAQSGNVGFSTGQQTPNSTLDAQAKDATDKLNNVVQLSADQYNQVLQVNKNYFYHPQNSPVGRGAARHGYDREQQLKSILTADQWQRYESAKQQGQL